MSRQKDLDKLIAGDYLIEDLDEYDFPWDDEVLALDGKKSTSKKPAHERAIKHDNKTIDRRSMGGMSPGKRKRSQD